jgi:hypothetical protein
MTAYLKNKLLDHATGKTAYTKPDAVYLAAFVGDPEGAGNEVTANTTTDYIRKVITFGSAADAGAIPNTAEVNFGVAGSAWGTITHLAIYDAETSGNRLWSDEMAASQTIDANEQLTIPISSLDLSLT